MHTKTLFELSHALQSKQISSEELTRYFIERCRSFHTELNCLITLSEERAYRQARDADRCLQQGKAGPLTGIPLIHKDIYCTKGIKTSCASKMLDNFIAPYDATVVEKLDQAGMVLIGKANMDEFAMGSSNETSFYGPVSNPWQLDHVPGGSSGGSAAAIAAGLAVAATGTDTGGSIRQPAALCGTTGLKPTYGRVSRYGIIAFASSLDQGGPITRSAQDAAMLLQGMAGFDPRDSTSSRKAPEDYLENLDRPIRGIKIGLPKEYLDEKLDPAIAENLNQAIEVLEKQGAHIQTITLPHIPLAIPVYYIISSAECSSNLARYDGIRFGHRCKGAKDLEEMYRRSRSEGLGKEVKRRIMVGTYALSIGYYDAYYLKAQRIRRLIQQDFIQAFDTVDVIIGPTTPEVAFKKNERMDNPVDMYLSDIYTTPASLAGLPALSIPTGFKNDLPIGMQIIGPYFSESRLLNLAHQYQRETDWHLHIPRRFR